MTSHERAVIGAMEQYGGSFVSALANAWLRADYSNHARLKVAFPEYWGEYERMVERREESDRESDRQAKEDGE